MKLDKYLNEGKSAMLAMRASDKYNKDLHNLEMKMVKTMSIIIDNAPLEDLSEIETYLLEMSLDSFYVNKLLDKIAKKQLGKKAGL